MLKTHMEDRLVGNTLKGCHRHNINQCTTAACTLNRQANSSLEHIHIKTPEACWVQDKDLQRWWLATLSNIIILQHIRLLDSRLTTAMTHMPTVGCTIMSNLTNLFSPTLNQWVPTPTTIHTQCIRKCPSSTRRECRREPTSTLSKTKGTI